MKLNITEKSKNRKSRIDQQRAAASHKGPSFNRASVGYDMSDRITATINGGIGAIKNLVNRLGLRKTINDSISLLKVYRPYDEADHVFNIAFNTLCGGRVLDDLHHLKADEAFLQAMTSGRIPDATTAGDFLRRFSEQDIVNLMDGINRKRVEVWKQQEKNFFETARIDVDGVIVGTTGECKQGMDISYKGIWGYHPLLVSLANTQEPIFIVNRSGNEPSQSSSAPWLTKAARLCREAGFKDVLLRGDTAFSLTHMFDEWTREGYRFVFGYPVKPNFIEELQDSYLFDESEYEALVRTTVKLFQRQRPENVKAKIVEERGFTNKVLKNEDYVEFDHKPKECAETYRIVALRKTITTEQYGKPLFEDYKYFLYITNDRSITGMEVIWESNKRCDQENLNEQLQNGTRSLKAPLDNLLSNWAYMVTTSLAWTLKSWMALSLQQKENFEERKSACDSILRMEFRTFVDHFIKIPAQALTTGRKFIFRILAWKPNMDLFLQMALE